MYEEELQKYFGWLELNDAKDVEWAINYLVQRGIYPTRNVTDRNVQFLAFLALDIHSRINPDRDALMLDRMKKAYGSKQRRKDPSKVSVTYVMSKKAKAALKQLAKGSKEIHELERLIFDVEDVKRECRNELKAKKQELERRYEKKEQSLAQKYENEALVKKNEELQIALERAQTEAKRNDNFYKAALRRATELEVSAGMQHSSVAVQLTDEEQREVQKRFIAKLKPSKSNNYH
ncbi:hypothetical protein [uncultured Marinobacter sp.]|uniref:hypothetical protein n=1 Tax=uncultured Marinobacter sp. TaxID=187379 RepID=UPI0030D831D0|tara:strand:- start:1218 stop:1919 length:702 start_codon:yes stop_codon:yes gene_type:complete